MLSVFDLLLIKENNNNEKIIYFQYEKKEFVFRLINAKEYTQAKMLTSSVEEFDDAICQLALLEPADYKFINSELGAFSDRMAQKIIELSCITDEKKVIEMLENSRKKLKLFIEQGFLFVKAAFPEYSFEEIKEWNYEKLMDMIAKAEFVLQLRNRNPEEGEIKLQYDIEDFEKQKEDNKNIPLLDLVENGIDPMNYYSDQIELKKPLIDKPIIIGSDWNKEEVLNGVRQQILNRRHN